MDVIRLKGLTGFGYHGVLESEQRDGQEFSVDLELSLQLSPAGNSDDLSLTVDYSEVAAIAVEIVETERFQLIEALAERIAQRLLETYAIDQIRVTVHKPSAPITVKFQDVQVEIMRSR